LPATSRKQSQYQERCKGRLEYCIRCITRDHGNFYFQSAIFWSHRGI